MEVFRGEFMHNRINLHDCGLDAVRNQGSGGSAYPESTKKVQLADCLAPTDWRRDMVPYMTRALLLASTRASPWSVSIKRMASSIANTA